MTKVTKRRRGEGFGDAQFGPLAATRHLPSGGAGCHSLSDQSGSCTCQKGTGGTWCTLHGRDPPLPLMHPQFLAQWLAPQLLKKKKNTGDKQLKQTVEQILTVSYELFGWSLSYKNFSNTAMSRSEKTNLYSQSKHETNLPMVVMGLEKGTMPQELPKKRHGAKPNIFCNFFCRDLQTVPSSKITCL